MSELRDAVNKVQNLGGLFKAVMIIADEVNKVDKIEQLTGEVNVRLVAKQAEERDIDARLVAGNHIGVCSRQGIRRCIHYDRNQGCIG